MQHNHSFDRRTALKAGALGGLMGALSRTSFAAAPPWMQGTNHKLLTIFLRGGYDSVNALIPYGDSAYNVANRGVLHIPQQHSIPIPGTTFTALNPALWPLGPLMTGNRIVFAQAVGNPARTGSHFEDQRTWETAMTGCVPPPHDIEEGWVTRVVSGLFPGGFKAASVSNGMQQLFRTRLGATGTFNADRVLPHIKSVRDFPGDSVAQYTLATTASALDTKLRGSTTAPFPYGLRALYNGGAQVGHVKDDFARAVGEAMLNSEIALSSLPNPYLPLGGAVYPFGHPSSPSFPMPVAAGLMADDFNVRRFFMYLRDAMMILRHVPEVRVVGIEAGSFDTHSVQGSVTATGQPEGHLARLLEAVAFGLREIDKEAQAGAFGSASLTSLVFSEFGRTSKVNSSDGTDHGGATCVWVAGSRARPNGASLVYNDGTVWPGMFSANDLDFGCVLQPPTLLKHFVAMRTDFRAIFAEVLTDLFGASISQVDQVIPGFSSLGLTQLDCIV